MARVQSSFVHRMSGYFAGDFAVRESKEADRLDARQAAARFARGNVAIQNGSFVTTDDLEEERRQLSTINFPSR